MSLPILTKLAKFICLGSVSAYLSFSSRNNPKLQLALTYVLVGAIVILIVAALWEARDYISGAEDEIKTIISGITKPQPKKRNYHLSTETRLEIVFALGTIMVCTALGSL